MNNNRSVFSLIFGLFVVALLLFALAGCGDTPPVEKPPVIVTKEVKVPVPVPCSALAKLGADPSYSDPDGLLLAAEEAGNIWEVVRLLMLGREERSKRLIEYRAAREACE